MFPTPYFEIISLMTETVSRISPAFVKGIRTDIDTIALAQIVTVTAISFFLLSPNDFTKITKLTYINLLHYIFLGIVSYTSITLTFFAYKELPVSMSLILKSLFPVFLVILYFFAGFEQPLHYLPLFLGSFFIMLYVLRPQAHHIEKFLNMEPTKKHKKYRATLALVVAALLSTIGHTFKKIGIDNHETKIIHTNAFALIISLFMFIYNNKMPDLRPAIWLKLIIFNILIVFVISKVRSLSFESVPEIYYAIFIFLGTAASFMISENIPIFKNKETGDFKIEEQHK